MRRRTMTALIPAAIAAVLAVATWAPPPRLFAPVDVTPSAAKALLGARTTQVGEAVEAAPRGSIGFVNYPAPGNFPFRNRAGETSIGVNPRTNATMFLLALNTARVTWDDTQSPPVATWTNVSYPLTSRITLDPILWTDRATGRTFVVQLAGEHSLVAFTDDDGQSWVPTDPPTAAPAFDHETLGGGPYAAPVVNPAYPNALYYCAQLLMGECARSDTGGAAWNAPVPMNVGKCISIHGHVVVNSVGHVFVPHGNCGDGPVLRRQAVVVSEDNGLTWHKRIVPDVVSRSDFSFGDPTVAFDRSGRLYFATASAGRPVVASSDDEGRTWTPSVDVGEALGIRNVQFPMVVAGDAGRAAFAFYGTTTEGSDQSSEFLGVWHVYVSFTYDGGRTWETVDATPTDPVQRGCIWLRGGGNPCRNLLDFQGATVDAEGRVLVGWADGCISDACLGAGGTPDDSRDSLGTIARQTTGKRLYAAFDPA